MWERTAVGQHCRCVLTALLGCSAGAAPSPWGQPPSSPPPPPLPLTPQPHSLTHTRAQECVLEKAITDGKAPGVIARLAKQAALFYHECAGLLGAPPLNQVCAEGGWGGPGRRGGGAEAAERLAVPARGTCRQLPAVRQCCSAPALRLTRPPVPHPPCLRTPPRHCPQHFDRSWLAHAQVKALLYDVEATVQNSAALRDADEFAGVAKEIARLRVRFGCG